MPKPVHKLGLYAKMGLFSEEVWHLNAEERTFSSAVNLTKLDQAARFLEVKGLDNVHGK